METLLVGNMVMILFWIFMTLTANDAEKYKVIVLLYIITYLVNILNIVSTIESYILLLISLFIYFELFEDHFKKILLKNIVDKILDFLYIISTEYAFIIYTLSLLFSSEFLNNSVGTNEKLCLYGLSFILLYISCINAAKEKYKIKTFDSIKKMIDGVKDYRSYLELEEPLRDPECILIIEDKNYFYRGEKYTFLCKFYFQKRYLNKMKDYLIRLLKSREKKKKLERAIRGYSTIEMQLLRTLAIEEGYSCVIRRKLYELLYSRIFLRNLRRYYKKCNCIVEPFKEYLLYIYASVAPCLNKGGEKRFNEVIRKDRKNLFSYTKEELFVLTLCFSGKIKKHDVMQTYENEIIQLNLNTEILKRFILQLQD